MLSNSEFKNVYDLGASRKVKEATGQGRGIRVTTPDSPEMTKHEDEALAIHKEPEKKKSAYDKAMEYLGL